MANQLELQPGERVLKDDREVIWLMGWFAKPRGRLVFTTQRLVFELPKAVAVTASQALVNEVVNHTPIDVPRDRLDAVERGTYRKSDNVIVVRTEDEELKFLLRTPAKEWEATLKQALHDDKVALQHLLDRLKPKENPPPYR